MKTKPARLWLIRFGRAGLRAPGMSTESFWFVAHALDARIGVNDGLFFPDPTY